MAKTKVNEFGARLFASAMDRYEKGTGDVQQALRDAARGYGDMHAQIVKANDGEVPAGPKMARELKKALEKQGIQTVNNVDSWISDRRYRAALLWMFENVDHVTWVFANSEASTPLSVKNAWTLHFKKTVRDARKENAEDGNVQPKDLTGTLNVAASEIEAEWTKQDEAAAKAAERKAEKEAATPPGTADYRSMPATDLAVVISHMLDDRPDFEVILGAIYKAKKTGMDEPPKTTVTTGDILRGPKSQARYELNYDDNGKLTEDLRRERVEFAVFTHADEETPVLKGRVIGKGRNKRIVVLDDENLAREEIAFTKPSARQFKIALGEHLGRGLGAFTVDTKNPDRDDRFVIGIEH